MEFLELLKRYQSICWYPSAGSDYRPLFYLSKNFAEKKGWKEEQFPDCFIYTDVADFGGPEYSFAPLVNHIGGSCTLMNDGRTQVTASQIDLVDKIAVARNEELTDGQADGLYGNVYFARLNVKSNLLGEVNVDFYYVVSENTAFAMDFLLKNKVNVDYIVHVRYGNAFGGGRSDGMFVRKLFFDLNTRYFITDRCRTPRNDLGYLLYEDLLKDRRIPKFKKILTVPGISWSDSGDVSWLRNNLSAPISRNDEEKDELCIDG